MSVTNGQPVNAETTNAAFVSRTSDTSTTGKLSLNNGAVDSGASILNIQKAINNAMTAAGTTESDSAPNDYSSNNFITDGDSRKVAIEKIDTQLGTVSAIASASSASISAHSLSIFNLENKTNAGFLQTSTISNNVTTPSLITGFFFDVQFEKTFVYRVDITRSVDGFEYRQHGVITFIYNTITGVEVVPVLHGDDCGVEFSVTNSSGTQWDVKYISSNIVGTGYLSSFKFRKMESM